VLKLNKVSAVLTTEGLNATHHFVKCLNSHGRGGGQSDLGTEDCASHQHCAGTLDKEIHTIPSEIGEFTKGDVLIYDWIRLAGDIL